MSNVMTFPFFYDASFPCKLHQLFHFERLIMAVSSSAVACINHYLDALCNRDQEAFREAWHADGLRLALTPNGTVEKQDVDLCAHSLALNAPIKEGHLLSLTLVSDKCACAKLRLVDSSRIVTEFVTLLRQGEEWTIISNVQSIVQESIPIQKINPYYFTEVSKAVWEGYVAAGRACDSKAMGRIFHPLGRLTFVSEDSITIIDSEAFCSMVENRWSMEMYASFAYLKNDDRIAAADSIVSIDFAGPNVAMVTLNIGFPPFLYHDVLLLLRLTQPVVERLNSSAGWWIVAKSSDHEPWMECERVEKSVH